MKTHLSGIIPLANYETDIEVGFPEFLLPAQNGFSLIQKSVLNVPWQVAIPYGLSQMMISPRPITRAIMWGTGHMIRYTSREIWQVSIIPNLEKKYLFTMLRINPKDRDRRDSIWLVGVTWHPHSIYDVLYSISKWIDAGKIFYFFSLWGL